MPTNVGPFLDANASQDLENRVEGAVDRAEAVEGSVRGMMSSGPGRSAIMHSGKFFWSKPESTILVQAATAMTANAGKGFGWNIGAGLNQPGANGFEYIALSARRVGSIEKIIVYVLDNSILQNSSVGLPIILKQEFETDQWEKNPGIKEFNLAYNIKRAGVTTYRIHIAVIGTGTIHLSSAVGGQSAGYWRQTGDGELESNPAGQAVANASIAYWIGRRGVGDGRIRISVTGIQALDDAGMLGFAASIRRHERALGLLVNSTRPPALNSVRTTDPLTANNSSSAVKAFTAHMQWGSLNQVDDITFYLRPESQQCKQALIIAFDGKPDFISPLNILGAVLTPIRSTVGVMEPHTIDWNGIRAGFRQPTNAEITFLIVLDHPCFVKGKPFTAGSTTYISTRPSNVIRSREPWLFLDNQSIEDYAVYLEITERAPYFPEVRSDLSQAVGTTPIPKIFTATVRSKAKVQQLVRNESNQWNGQNMRFVFYSAGASVGVGNTYWNHIRDKWPLWMNPDQIQDFIRMGCGYLGARSLSSDLSPGAPGRINITRIGTSGNLTNILGGDNGSRVGPDGNAFLFRDGTGVELEFLGHGIKRFFYGYGKQAGGGTVRITHVNNGNAVIADINHSDAGGAGYATFSHEFPALGNHVIRLICTNPGTTDSTRLFWIGGDSNRLVPEILLFNFGQGSTQLPAWLQLYESGRGYAALHVPSQTGLRIPAPDLFRFVLGAELLNDNDPAQLAEIRDLYVRWVQFLGENTELQWANELGVEKPAPADLFFPITHEWQNQIPQPRGRKAAWEGMSAAPRYQVTVINHEDSNVYPLDPLNTVDSSGIHFTGQGALPQIEEEFFCALFPTIYKVRQFLGNPAPIPVLSPPYLIAQLPAINGLVGDSDVIINLNNYFAGATSYAILGNPSSAQLNGNQITISHNAEVNETVQVQASNSDGTYVGQIVVIITENQRFAYFTNAPEETDPESDSFRVKTAGTLFSFAPEFDGPAGTVLSLENAPAWLNLENGVVSGIRPEMGIDTAWNVVLHATPPDEDPDVLEFQVASLTIS